MRLNRVKDLVHCMKASLSVVESFVGYMDPEDEDGKDIKSLFRQGEGLIQRGSLDEATILYTKIMDQSTDRKEVLWAKKHIADIVGYCGHKKYDEAVRLYREIMAKADDFSDLIDWCKIDIERSESEKGG